MPALPYLSGSLQPHLSAQTVELHHGRHHRDYVYAVNAGTLGTSTEVEPALAGTYAFVNPVVAVLLGWAFAGEQLNTGMLGGAALIVVAVALVVLGGRRAGK